MTKRTTTASRRGLQRAKHLLAAAIPCGLLLFSLATSFLPARVAAAPFDNVSAADVQNASYAWVDQAHINVTIGGTTLSFWDEGAVQNHSNREDYYRFISKDTPCNESTIWANSLHPDKVGHVEIHYKTTPNGACSKYDNGGKTPPNATISQTDRADILYNISGSTIKRIDNAKWYTFNRNGDHPTLYVMPKQGNQDTCFDTIVVTPGSDHAVLWELSAEDEGKGRAPDNIEANGCFISNLEDDVNGPKMTHVLDNEPSYQCPDTGVFGPPCSEYKRNGDGSFTIHLNAAAPAADTGTGTSDGESGCSATDTDAQGNCNSSTQVINCLGGVFSWLICPAIEMFVHAGQLLDSFIMSTLDIDVQPIFDTPNQKGTASYGYYTAWNAFRVIATALIVVAGLVMVASQALGFEFLDAYTIRKTLPRLVVAIIGISLSWPLMRFAVELFDNMGVDIRGLIYGPFKDFNAHYSLGASILSYVVAGAGLAALGFASLTIFLSLLITIFIGFIALVIRQIAIVLLIILAPVAIACYILPNTQKVWKLWHENFFGLLLAFPLISAAIAAGHVFAIVAISTGTKNAGSLSVDAMSLVTHFTMHGFTQTLADVSNNIGGLVAQGTALFADNAPKLAIGWLMQRGVGIISKVSGGAGGLLGLNTASKALSKYRAKTAGERFRKMQNQSLWDNSSKVGKFMNKAATWATDPLNNLAYAAPNAPGLRKRAAKVAHHIEHARVEQSKKLFEEMNAAGYNDKAYRVMSGQWFGKGGLSADVQEELRRRKITQPPQSLQEIQEMASILRQKGSGSEQLAANAIEGSSGRIATLYQDPEMSKASVRAAGIMGLSAHGFADGDDLSGAGNALQEEGGKAFSQAVIVQSQLFGARSRPDIKAGYGVMYDEQAGKWVNGMTADPASDLRRDEALIMSTSSHDWAGAKSGAFDAVAPTFQRALDEGDTPKATAIREQLFSLAGQYSQASGDIKAKALTLIDDHINGRRRLADGTVTMGPRDEALKKAWDAYNRVPLDPNERGGGRPGEPEPPPGGPGSGGH